MDTSLDGIIISIISVGMMLIGWFVAYILTYTKNEPNPDYIGYTVATGAFITGFIVFVRIQAPVGTLPAFFYGVL